MKTHHARRALEVLPVAIGVLLILFALLAGGTLAATGGMSGMDGMTDEQMQAMDGMDGMDGMTAEQMQGMTDEEMQAMHGSDASGGTDDAHGAAAATDTHGGMNIGGMDMGGGSVNWIVIGGFIVLVVGSTLAAVITKRHLRQRMQTGELAAAGVQDV